MMEKIKSYSDFHTYFNDNKISYLHPYPELFEECSEISHGRMN